MNRRELAELIDRFNEENTPFAIGMNFVVAGIGSVQELIKGIEEDTIDAARAKELLLDAEKMLGFGRDRVQRDRDLFDFVERYLGLVADLKRAI